MTFEKKIYNEFKSVFGYLDLNIFCHCISNKSQVCNQEKIKQILFVLGYFKFDFKAAVFNSENT